MALHMTETTSRLTLIVGLSVIMAACSSSKDPSAIAEAPDITITDRVSSQQKYTQAQADRDNRQTQGNLTVAVPRVYVDSDQIEADAPNSYTVVRGDTLWDISDRFLKEPWRWKEIWGYNPQIVNPDLIYPGDRLALDYVDGKPTLSLTRNNRLISPGPVSGVRASSADDASAYRNTSDSAGSSTSDSAGRNARVKLSPRVRSESLEDAIPVISSESISQFLIHPLVLDNNTIRKAPYIIANDEDRLIASTGSKIYARGRFNRAVTSYSVYRKSKELIDPVSGAHLGYEVTHVSNAKLLSVGDPSTLTLTSNIKETITGDFLLPANTEATPLQYVQRLPKLLGDARIVSLVDAISQSGRNQIVVLNVGADSSIQSGDVLAVETAGHLVNDKHGSFKGDEVNLPNQRTGVLMVFRTFDKVSYALVMESTRPIKVNDFVTGI